GAHNPYVTPFAGATYVAINPVTQIAYIPTGGNDIRVAPLQPLQAVPLTTTIDALPENITTDTTPTFNLSVQSNFFPFDPAVDGVVFQVDTWQNKWLPAQSTGFGSYQATVPTALQIGAHVIYAYATDSMEPSGLNGADGSGPQMGLIGAYYFVVKPAET